MPLAGYAWSQIRTQSEIAVGFGSDLVGKPILNKSAKSASPKC